MHFISDIILSLLFKTVTLQCSFQALDLVVYEGCFVDDINRKYPYSYGHLVNLTIDYCILGCADDGFEYAAVEASEFCFCGHDPYLSIGTYPKVDQTECNQPCIGNSNQLCGGPWRMSIYKIHEPKSEINMRQYASVFLGKSITTDPLSTKLVRGTGLRAIYNCAQSCTETAHCKVFSFSSSSNMCFTFKGAKLCDSLNSDADSTIFYLL